MPTRCCGRAATWRGPTPLPGACRWRPTRSCTARPPRPGLAARRLVQALGLQDEFVAARVSTGPYAVMDFLVSDDSHPGSVVSSVQAVRENLRIVRDRIPVELWEEANSLYILMQSAIAVSAGAREQTGGEVSRMSVITARRGCRSLSGVMTESMMRDEGYAFMEVGRLLERSILTVELLKSGLGTGSDVFDGNRLLAFTHSLQAARREIGHSPSWVAVARFLPPALRSAPIGAVVSGAGGAATRGPGSGGRCGCDAASPRWGTASAPGVRRTRRIAGGRTRDRAFRVGHGVGHARDRRARQHDCWFGPGRGACAIRAPG